LESADAALSNAWGLSDQGLALCEAWAG
jgi:hypothetical protein